MKRLLICLLLLAGINPASAQMLMLGYGRATLTGNTSFMATPLMSAGSTSAPSTSAVNFGRIASGITNGQWNASAAVEEDPWPVAGTISNLSVYFPTDPGNTNGSYDVGLVLGGTKQTLVCNVAIGTHTCTDNTHSVTIAAGNLVGWFVCPSGTATCTAGNAPTAQGAATQISATFTSTVGQESLIIGHNTNVSATVLNYGGFGGNITVSATEVNVSSVIPVSGTLDDLQVVSGGVPGTNGTYTLTVFHNTSATSLTCVVASAGTTCSDSTGAHAFTVAQGDTISLQSCPSSSGNTLSCTGATGTAAPTARAMSASMRWVPSTANQAILFDTAGTAPPTTTGVTRYQSVSGTGAAGTTEVDLNVVPVVSGGMTLGNLIVSESAAPGGTSTRAITLRAGAGGGAAQSDRAPTCTITSAATSCTSGSTYSASSGQAINMSMVNTGTQAAITWFKTAMTVTIP
jgi:hypothetical protein